MLFLGNGYYDADPGMPAKRDVANSCHWNLWKIRMRPFNEIEDGTGYHPRGFLAGWSSLTWEIAATEVVAKPYSSKRCCSHDCQYCRLVERDV